MSEDDPRERVRPDVWGDDPPARGGSVPLDAVPQDPVALPPPGRPLDLSQDPDRVQPDRPVLPPTGPFPPGVPLDLSRDPDRYRPGSPGDRTLTDLLGKGGRRSSATPTTGSQACWPCCCSSRSSPSSRGTSGRRARPEVPRRV